MNTYKKFIPCIYLKEGKAVAGFQNNTVLSEEPVALAKYYSDCNADELLVFDLSYDDTTHEAALDVLKEICNQANIPVIGAGNVKRMEDIKKLLYAGCMKAALNYSKEGNIEITKEVSDKFGKEKLWHVSQKHLKLKRTRKSFPATWMKLFWFMKRRLNRL